MHNTSYFAHHDGFSVHAHVASVPAIIGGTPEMPLLSIMIPTYRRPQLLREAIASALAQHTDVPFEVCVVDNDPDAGDEVDAVIRSFASPRVSLYRNRENIGMFGNWNRCLQLARGKYVSILNDDDKLAPGFVAEAMEATAGSALVFCGYEWFGHASTKSRAWVSQLKLALSALFRSGRISVPELIWAYPLVGTLGVILDRRASLELGGFWPDFYPISDRVFLVRYILQHGAHALKPRLAHYRWEANESLREATATKTFEAECRLRADMVDMVSGPASTRERLHRVDGVINSARLAKLKRQFGNKVNVDPAAASEGGKLVQKLPTAVIALSVLYAQFVARRNRIIA